MYRSLFGLTLIWVATTIVAAQQGSQPSSQFQHGTITAVTAHQDAPGEPAGDVVKYDVSVEVGNVLYVVLFTPPNGSKTVEYSRGMGLLVLVGSNTLTFNSAISGRTEVPILRREELAGGKTIDRSKVPGQYFGMKLQNLSEKLNLTEDQQAKIKPTLEQESGEVGQIWLNTGMSSKEKMNRYQKIVRASDEKIRPVLSPEQLQKLQEMRKEQKQELKRVFEEQKTGTKT